MKCCICKESIDVQTNGWSEGHNAEPVIKEGRCCSECNASVVIPTRMSNLLEPNRGKRKGPLPWWHLDRRDELIEQLEGQPIRIEEDRNDN